MILSLGKQAEERRRVQGIIRQNLLNIQTRISEHAAVPFFRTYFRVRTIDTTEDMSAFGQRIFTPTEIDKIIQKSNLIVPLDQKTDISGDFQNQECVSPTFGRQASHTFIAKNEAATESPIMVRIPLRIRKCSDVSDNQKTQNTRFGANEDDTTDVTQDNQQPFGLAKSDAANHSQTTYIGKLTLDQRSARIKKYKMWQVKRWGTKLDDHKRAIRGFKGRSEVALAKPRINGKYVKKEIYQAWLKENDGISTTNHQQ